jgi:hypothetical protein
MRFTNRADDLRAFAAEFPGLFDVQAPKLWRELANINEGIAAILAVAESDAPKPGEGDEG